MRHVFTKAGWFSLRDLRGRRAVNTEPWVSHETDQKRTSGAEGFSYTATGDDPVLCIRRVDRHRVRIEDFEGAPYSEPMPLRQAQELLNETTKERA